MDKRISEHKIGAACAYTAQRLPVEIVFVETFGSRDEAFILERQLKGWSRKKKEALINRDWQGIIALSKKNFKNKNENHLLHPSIHPISPAAATDTQDERVGDIVFKKNYE